MEARRIQPRLRRRSRGGGGGSKVNQKSATRDETVSSEVGQINCGNDSQGG